MLLFGFNLRLQPIITLQPATLLSIVNLVLKTFGSQDGILHPWIIQEATKERKIEFITKFDMIKEPSEQSSQNNLLNHLKEDHLHALNGSYLQEETTVRWWELICVLSISL